METQGRPQSSISPKQQVFVSAYLGEANRNATEAARIAGYAHPLQQGPRLLGNVGIQAAIDEQIGEIKRKGIALHQNRVDALAERHRLLQQVIAERAAEMDGEASGGGTGLLVRKIKVTKQGVLHEYAVDTGLLAEMRAHEQQIAQELGEWIDKQQVDGNSTQVVEIVGVDVSQI